jgi:hypothetical protein
MEALKSLVEGFYERSEAYVRTTFELTKLKGVETAAKVVTTLIVKMSVVTVFLICLFMLSIGAAFWLGEVLGKLYYGFFIIAGFYLIAGIILAFSLQKWIKRPVENIIIRQSLK